MKKIILLLITFFCFFSFVSANTNDCSYDFDNQSLDVWTALDWCIRDSKLVNWEDLWIDDGSFSDQVEWWVDNIALYLWVFAVWSIVLGAIMMTISWWEEEKIKKGKDIVKWGIVWFLAVIWASAVINLVVKIMYSI